MVCCVSLSEPIVWLPEHIWLTRDDAHVVLRAVDIAVEAAAAEADHEAALQAKHLITRRLWDELADILETNGEHHG